MDTIIIKMHANGSVGVWTDSNHREYLPKAQFKEGDTVTYLARNDKLVTGKITFVYQAQDIQELQQNKGRYCWHYGIDFVDGYPVTYRTEWELLKHNSKPFLFSNMLYMTLGMPYRSVEKA